MKQLLIIAVAILLLANQSLAKTQLTLVGNTGNYPVCYQDDSGKIVGINVDIIRELAKRMDIDINIQLVPWARTLSMIKHGQVDGGFPLFITPERQEYALYTSVPLHEAVMLAYVKYPETFSGNKLEDLYGKKIGINRGYSISAEFDLARKQDKFEVTEVEKIHQLVSMVFHGHLDALVAKRSSVGSYLKRSGKWLKVLGPINKSEGAFLVLSKKAKINNKQQLLKDINQTMQDMMADGTIERITRQYID